MSTVSSVPFGTLARRKPLPRIIIARGENIRAFTIRPWLTGIVFGVGFLLGVLYLIATGYQIFRDDLLAASIASQGRMQHAYEDRIASLRSDIDRLTSRQLLNQEAFDSKMDRLLGRQAALDARQDIIASLSQAARRAGLATVTPATPAPAPDVASSWLPTPRPDVSEPLSKFAPMKTGSAIPEAGKAAPTAVAMLRTATDPLPPSDETAKIGSVESSLDALAEDQVSFVEDIGSNIAKRTQKVAKILKKLGQDVPQGTRSDGGESDVGGPFIPLAANADPDTFRSGVELINGEIERFTQIRRLAGQLPLDRPMIDAAITSGFGARMDPFFGRPAMHPGIDFRAPLGSPVRATAAGTVISAGYFGGYGNMVEVDHGNGVTTRYGHMSAITVTVGQIVPKGGLLGRTGDTGRSTGPHLHYEIRLDGDAIDPMRYIRAGNELAPLL